MKYENTAIVIGTTGPDSRGVVQLKVACPFCRRPHFHGGPELGHRVPDCSSRGADGGYNLTDPNGLIKNGAAS